MMEVKGIGRRTQLLDDLRNRRRYWELKEEAEDRRTAVKQRLSIEHKDGRKIIFHKSTDLLISSLLINNNEYNRKLYQGTNRNRD